MKKYYYTIGEVSNLLQVKPHIIRYWESEFTQLHPGKTRGGNRKYSEKDIELLREIQDMLHNQKFTVQGAKKRLRDMARSEEQLSLNMETPREQHKARILRELKAIRALLLK